MQIGLYTFAELSPDPQSGRVISPEQRVRDLMEEIELAHRVARHPRAGETARHGPGRAAPA